MKLKNKNTHLSKVKLILIVVIFLVILAGGIVAAYTVNKANNTANEQNKTNKTSPGGVNYGDPTNEQKQSGIDLKGNTQNDQPAVTKPGEPINVVMTALNPPTSTNPSLQIRVRIDTLTSNGICTLTLTKGRTVITKQSGIQAGPTTSTCQGFDVAGSELSSGSWNAALKVASNNQEGSVSQMFTVQ